MNYVLTFGRQKHIYYRINGWIWICSVYVLQIETMTITNQLRNINSVIKIFCSGDNSFTFFCQLLHYPVDSGCFNLYSCLHLLWSIDRWPPTSSFIAIFELLFSWSLFHGGCANNLVVSHHYFQFLRSPLDDHNSSWCSVLRIVWRIWNTDDSGSS